MSIKTINSGREREETYLVGFKQGAAYSLLTIDGRFEHTTEVTNLSHARRFPSPEAAEAVALSKEAQVLEVWKNDNMVLVLQWEHAVCERSDEVD